MSAEFKLVCRGDKYGYINAEGVEVVAPKYSTARRFKEGIACVSKDGKYGYIDEEGAYIVELKYDNGCSFKEGLACVRKDGKYGYINKKGEEVIPLKYVVGYGFKNGLACVASYDSKKDCDKYGYINKKGDEVIPLKYDLVSTYFKGGMAVVENSEGDCAIIDTKGSIVKDFLYDFEEATDLLYELIDLQ